MSAGVRLERYIGVEHRPGHTRATCRLRRANHEFGTNEKVISNWLNTNTTVAGSWGIPVDRIRVGNTVVDTSAEFVGPFGQTRLMRIGFA